MIGSLNEVTADTPLTADVCIVGSGAAGISIALELERSGQSVLLIESGGMHPLATTDALNAGENVGTLPLRLTQTRTRALGGTTRLWYGQCITLDPIDYEARPWVPHSGWPLRPNDLEPYYRRAEQFFRIPEDGYDERIYLPFGLRPPRFSAAAFELKPTIYSPVVDFHQHFRAALHRSRRIRVLCDATARHIRLNAARGTVESIEICNLQGKRSTVTAKVYVVACGGIENARLLLASNVGNDRDQVGRFLQDHLTGDIAELQASGAVPLQDVFGLLYRGKLRFFPKFRLSAAAQREHRVLNATMHLRFDHGTTAVESLRTYVRSLRRGRLPPDAICEAARILRDLPATARVAYRRYVRGLSPDTRPERIVVQAHIEQMPNAQSRVTLSTARDALGQPLARVDWRPGELEQRTFQTMCSLLQKESARLRLGTLVPQPWLTHSNWTAHVQDTSHPTGATRMATSAAHGVVDANCRVFGVNNLYLAGSSVFPTNGYANPTLTIVALAFRLSDHLRRHVLA